MRIRTDSTLDKNCLFNANVWNVHGRAIVHTMYEFQRPNTKQRKRKEMTNIGTNDAHVCLSKK